MIRRSLFAVLVLVASAPSIYAADAAPSPTDLAAPLAVSVPPLVDVARPSLPNLRTESTARPAALPLLYASLAALHTYDAYSTLHGVANGAQESNGLMRGAAGSAVAMIGVKAAVTTLPIALAEHMWRTNRTAAIVMMVVSNGMMAAVAANNAHVLHQVR